MFISKAYDMTKYLKNRSKYKKYVYINIHQHIYLTNNFYHDINLIKRCVYSIAHRWEAEILNPSLNAFMLDLEYERNIMISVTPEKRYIKKNIWTSTYLYKTIFSAYS